MHLIITASLTSEKKKPMLGIRVYIHSMIAHRHCIWFLAVDIEVMEKKKEGKYIMYIFLWEQFTGKAIDAFSSGKCQLPLTFHFLSFSSKSWIKSTHKIFWRVAKKG